MKTNGGSALVAMLILGAALLACGGKEAMEDLDKLKVKTCSCKGESKCVEDAKGMAREWVTKHKEARGVDQQRVQTTMTELMACDMSVGAELAKAAK